MMVNYSEPVNLDVNTLKLTPIDSVGGGHNLYHDDCHNFAWCENIFTNTQLDAIISICNSLEFDKGMTASTTQDDKVRNSSVKFIYPNNRTRWIFDALTESIHHMNKEYFGFDLGYMAEGIQLTRYEAPTQHYEWHCDRGMAVPVRKLSLALQLSDPSDYSGGDLELMIGETPEKAKRDRGVATFFPSWLMHRVTPVTEGTRYSLVCWISGPPFR
jgi:PKHD-type hydroxylase